MKTVRFWAVTGAAVALAGAGYLILLAADWLIDQAEA